MFVAVGLMSAVVIVRAGDGLRAEVPSSARNGKARNSAPVHAGGGRRRKSGAGGPRRSEVEASVSACESKPRQGRRGTVVTGRVCRSLTSGSAVDLPHSAGGW